MFLGARLNRSLQSTLKQTDVWSGNHYVFRLSGAGHATERGQISKRPTEYQVRSASPSKSPGPKSPMGSQRGSFGHLPLTTIRDVSTFEQVGGSELANKHLMMELYQRASTCEYPPGTATLESTAYHPSRYDLHDISLGEERSLDSAGDRRIFLADNSISY